MLWLRKKLNKIKLKYLRKNMLRNVKKKKKEAEEEEVMHQKKKLKKMNLMEI